MSLIFPYLSEINLSIFIILNQKCIINLHTLSFLLQESTPNIDQQNKNNFRHWQTYRIQNRNFKVMLRENAFNFHDIQFQ